MSAKAAARRRAQAVNKRPRGLRQRHRTSSAAATSSFSALSKTARKSGAK